MKQRQIWSLIAGPGLAGAGLVLVFLLLGRSTAGATNDEHSTSPNPRSPSADFTISGTVTCEVAGLISDVEVYAWNRDIGAGTVGDVTDVNGACSVTLEEGNYDLIFNPPCGSGCASKAYKGITGPPDRTLNALLPSGHGVAGIVFAPNGTAPVGNVAIYAFNHDTADGFGLPPTDAHGRYCIGLVDGHYDLGFTPPPCLGLGPKTLDVTVTEDITQNIVLTSGFTVAGCIVDGIGNPVSGVQIYAYDPIIRGFGFAPSDGRGCYTGTLPLGTFDIQFIPPVGRGLGSITVVDVVSETADCSNTSLPITLPVGFTVSGQATCQTQPFKNVFVYADPVKGGAPGDDLVGWGVYSVDDGSYGLPVVPGTYDIKFIPPSATGFDMVVIANVSIITDTILGADLCPLVLKSVDDPFAVPGERRMYQVLLTPEREFAAARLTDTLPSAVTWAGDISATSGSASYSERAITWSGSLTTGMPVTITYDVTVTHAPRFGTAAHTDIYTDVTNDAVLDDGQGNEFTSTITAFAIGHPFGTGSERTFDLDFGDADNDGDLDLAVGSHAPNQVCWNNGDGSYDCTDEFGGSPTFDVEWGDMDGDGYLDLVVANSQGHSNLVCLTNRDRTFTCTNFSTCLGYASCAVALGDVDGDGDLDIALGNQKSPDLIYYNDGDGITFSITDTTCYPGATLDLAFGDVNNDGKLDLAVVGHSPDFVCMNDGTGTFTETRWLAYRLDFDTWCVALGDADGDGDLDIAAGEHTDYPIEIYLNNGYGYFTETLLIGPAWDSTGGLAWGDVDDDGDLDLASGNLYQQTVVYLNDPVTTTDSITFSRKIFLGTDSSRTNSVAFGDVDGDGHLDLAVGSDGGQNIVYLNTLPNCVYLPIVMKGWQSATGHN